jgi:hypothetical protein
VAAGPLKDGTVGPVTVAASPDLLPQPYGRGTPVVPPVDGDCTQVTPRRYQGGLAARSLVVEVEDSSESPNRLGGISMMGHLGYQSAIAHMNELRASADKARRASRPGRSDVWRLAFLHSTPPGGGSVGRAARIRGVMRRILVTAAVAGCLLGVTACADGTESVQPSSGYQPNVEIPDQTTLPPPDPPPTQLTAPGPCTGGAAGAIGDCGP